MLISSLIALIECFTYIFLFNVYFEGKNKVLKELKFMSELINKLKTNINLDFELIRETEKQSIFVVTTPFTDRHKDQIQLVLSIDKDKNIAILSDGGLLCQAYQDCCDKKTNALNSVIDAFHLQFGKETIDLSWHQDIAFDEIDVQIQTRISIHQITFAIIAMIKYIHKFEAAVGFLSYSPLEEVGE